MFEYWFFLCVCGLLLNLVQWESLFLLKCDILDNWNVYSKIEFILIKHQYRDSFLFVSLVIILFAYLTSTRQSMNSMLWKKCMRRTQHSPTSFVGIISHSIACYVIIHSIWNFPKQLSILFCSFFYINSIIDEIKRKQN